MILPRQVRSGVHRHTRLRAAGRGAEAGDHFVEDEQRAVRVAQLAQSAQEAVCWWHDAHVAGDRLDDERGDRAAMRLEHALDRVEVVVAGDSVSAAAPRVTPGLVGMPSVSAPEPACTRNASA